MKVYISASCPFKALGLKTLLQRRVKGLKVIARWIESPGLKRNTSLSTIEKNDKARRNLDDIRKADVVIQMDDYDMVPGGKHFELGWAYAHGKRCFKLGKHEHLYTWLNDVQCAENIEELIEALRACKKMYY